GSHGGNGGGLQGPMDEVHLLQAQMDVMGIKTGTFQNINLRKTVKASGHLGLSPQNKASVSALMAGRVRSLAVVEGNYVKKGSVLARLEHPEYIALQESYLTTAAELTFLQQEYDRKKALLADSITAERKFQETESKYRVAQARLNTLKARLQLLGISVSGLEKGEIASSIPILSPINGHVRSVEVNMGMSVKPEQKMFEIVDNDDIHIDLLVYEKDIIRVEVGQKVTFSMPSKPDAVFTAKISHVGKAFEDELKAVRVHAEIENHSGVLLPGMYVDGRIETDFDEVKALPEDAIVEDGGLSYIFVRDKSSEQKNASGGNQGHSHGADVSEGHSHGSDGGHGHDHGHSSEFIFKKIEVNIGARDIGFAEVVPAQEVAKDAEIVTKGAFYLLAELKKGEENPGHSHHH
ncbi:MAG: efflux RND transporter periplasmic adaptor subunit, partial [Bacteroidota bacterium]